jgi:hypothetical protein
MQEVGVMRRTLILHPFFFAIFPVLFLFARNVRDFPPAVMVRPALVALAATCAAVGLLRLVFKDWAKAAIVTTLLLLLTVSSGRILSAVAGLHLNAGFQPRGVTVTLLAGLLVSALVALARTRRSLADLTRILNFAAICLVAMPALGIARAYGHSIRAHRFVESIGDPPSASIATRAPSPRPHIFYIILDGYARSDNLKEIYQFDNSDFLGYLRSKGFRVVDAARANYPFTFLSITSSLNMRYLDDLDDPVNRNCDTYAVCARLVAHNRLREFLHGQGYTFVSFVSGFYATEIRDADRYMSPPWQLGEFEEGLVRTSAFVTDSMKVDKERRRILYEIANLGELAKSDKPLFVFAHIMCPHPPYVFGADGGPSSLRTFYWTATGDLLINRAGITRREDERCYTDQVAFINARMKAAIDAVLANSKTKPIIVLQGDHGHSAFLHHRSIDETYLQDRMSILNAYYLPDGGDSAPYDTITPVNSFRVILNYYFGTHFDRLADRNYFVYPSKSHERIDVTDRIGSAADREVYRRLKDKPYFDTPSTARPPTRNTSTSR